MKPSWIEAGIFFKPQFFTPWNASVFCCYIIKKLEYVSWHYFFEPNYEVRFRMLADKTTRDEVRKRIKKLQRDFTLITKVVYRKYYGEEEFYGKRGFDIAIRYFYGGSNIAQSIIYWRNAGLLTSPIKGWTPTHFHANRYVHLFMNQLGYSVWDEFKWALRYAWNRLCVWVKYRLQGVKRR